MDSYGKRLNRAAWLEYRKFWSGFRLLVTFSGLIAPALLKLQRGIHTMLPLAEAVESGAIGLSLSLLGTYVYSRRKGAEMLDLAWQSEISKQQQAISKSEGIIAALQKPARTPAEQHRYDTAKAALAKLPPEAVNVLQHLKTHETLIFSVGDPPLPQGINARDLRAILNLCVNEGLVTPNHTPKSGFFEYVYRVAPGMESALDEVLY